MRMANLLDLFEEPTTPTQTTPTHSNGEEEDGEGLNGIDDTESTYNHTHTSLVYVCTLAI